MLTIANGVTNIYVMYLIRLDKVSTLTEQLDYPWYATSEVNDAVCCYFYWSQKTQTGFLPKQSGEANNYANIHYLSC